MTATSVVVSSNISALCYFSAARQERPFWNRLKRTIEPWAAPHIPLLLTSIPESPKSQPCYYPQDGSLYFESSPQTPLSHALEDMWTKTTQEQPPSTMQISRARTHDASMRLFHHIPLNLGSHSLRLIRTLPSKHVDDVLQCQIETGTTDSEYICLSYV